MVKLLNIDIMEKINKWWIKNPTDDDGDEPEPPTKYL